MKKLIFAISLAISGAAFAQSVFVVESVKSQPLVYRNDSGGFKGCGIRSAFVTDVPTSMHLGDVSVNIFKQESGNIVALVKVIYSAIKNPGDPSSTKNLPLSKFMLASASGQAMKLSDTKNGEVANTYLAETSITDAIAYITDIIYGRTTQVGVEIKNSNSGLKIFSLKNKSLTPDEMNPLATCIRQISLK